jgi:hypothetical protein
VTILDKILGRGRGEPVIVISGLPRSGTSMAMKMVEAAGIEPFQDGVRTADEDNPKGYYEFEQVKELDKSPDKSWVKKARGRALKVISYLLGSAPTTVIFTGSWRRCCPQAKMLERRGERTTS